MRAKATKAAAARAGGEKIKTKSMKYVEIPAEVGARPPITFDFAVEEFVAHHFTDDDYCFVWQTEPTVIIGRNQLLVNEVNVDYCRDNNVFVARRKSGGGAVYSDEGNVMFSFISSEPDVQVMFRWAMGQMAGVLRELGVDASLSGRNDILVDGRKVAGAAFYRTAGRGVMHNTLLFKSDMTALQRAITPSREKLQSKGVKSVSQRVANVSEFLPGMTVGEFIGHARRILCGDNVRALTSEDMAEIRATQERMGRREWIYGRMPRHSEVRMGRLPGVGTIEAYLEVKDGRIVDLNLAGDFFIIGDVDRDIIAPLRHVPFTREGVREALGNADMDNVVRGLTPQGLEQVLFGED